MMYHFFSRSIVSLSISASCTGEEVIHASADPDVYQVEKKPEEKHGDDDNNRGSRQLSPRGPRNIVQLFPNVADELYCSAKPVFNFEKEIFHRSCDSVTKTDFP